MSWLLLTSLSMAGQVTSGHQIAPVDAGTGVGIGQQIVMGGDGGTAVTTATVRWALEDLHIAVGLPYGAYPTSAGRDASLGNLQLAAYYSVQPDITVGLEFHTNVGEGAWSWANRADELWPGAGLRGVFQFRRTNNDLSILARGAVGFATARAVAPFPRSRAQVHMAGALDYALTETAGFVGELSLRTWDTSPLDIAALGRLDIAPGVRARSGLVLPVGTWAGLSPSSRPAGVREATWLLDISAYF
jgi:hypothetical protein